MREGRERAQIRFEDEAHCWPPAFGVIIMPVCLFASPRTVRLQEPGEPLASAPLSEDAHMHAYQQQVFSSFPTLRGVRLPSILRGSL